MGSLQLKYFVAHKILSCNSSFGVFFFFLNIIKPVTESLSSLELIWKFYVYHMMKCSFHYKGWDLVRAFYMQKYMNFLTRKVDRMSDTYARLLISGLNLG